MTGCSSPQEQALSVGGHAQCVTVDDSGRRAVTETCSRQVLRNAACRQRDALTPSWMPWLESSRSFSSSLPLGVGWHAGAA